MKYTKEKIEKGLIEKLYLRHFKFKIKNDKGEFTPEAKRYIKEVNNELILNFDQQELIPESTDKTLDSTNWSFSAEELKQISGLDLLKFSEEDNGN